MGCTNSKADTVQGRLTSDASTPGAKPATTAKPATEHGGALDGAPRFTPGKLEDHYRVDWNTVLGKGHYASARRSSAEHLIATKALRYTATARMLIDTESFFCKMLTGHGE